VPELRFKYDDSVDKGERIEHLLRQDSPRSAASDDNDD
jgi:ribosome-binding factor A